MSKPLRVVLADDERPARRFLVILLKSFPDAEVVGEASNGREALDLIAGTKPALALLDLQMPELGGWTRRGCSRPARRPWWHSSPPTTSSRCRRSS